ncbi:MAG: tRNA1(Val) (adenine(37)-N6)-methyltransferase [Faecousia sp.]
MEILQNGYTLELCDGAFPLSTDSMALAYFARLGKNAKVLDLGSGCGTLGLMLCAKDPSCHVTGVELNEDAHNMALQNIARNALQARMASICADLKTIPACLPQGSFSVCISNPPYFIGGKQRSGQENARHEVQCSAEDVFSAAAWALKYGGDFYLVHKPERLSELMNLGSKYAMECKRLCLLRHSPETLPGVVLLAFRKGGKPGLKLEEICLRDSTGEFSRAYREIYHI